MRNGTKLNRKETVARRFNEMLVLGYHLLTMYAMLTRLELVDGLKARPLFYSTASRSSL